MTNISREQSTVGGTASDSPVMQGRNARENGHGAIVARIRRAPLSGRAGSKVTTTSRRTSWKMALGLGRVDPLLP